MPFAVTVEYPEMYVDYPAMRNPDPEERCWIALVADVSREPVAIRYKPLEGDDLSVR